MEIYLLKHFEKNPRIIQNYFFSVVDQLTYEKYLLYFISNSILTKEYNHNYYFSLPFKILSLLYKTKSSSLIKLTNRVSIPKEIWSKENFSLARIESINEKKKIMSVLLKDIESFLKNFYESKIITVESIEKLSEKMTKDFFERNQVVKTFNYLTLESVEESIPIYEESDLEISESYYNILSKFLKYCIDFYNVMNTTDAGNFDYFNTDISQAEKNSVIQNYRVQITQFFAKYIIRFILNDFVQITIAYLRKKANKVESE